MFTHLHVHTGYSLLDGSAKISGLIKKTKQLGMDSIAITDHGVMFGAIEFYKEALKEGIKPIIGCEVYVASGSRFDKNKDSFYYHLVLLAENNKGYENLSKIVSYGFLEGFYYKPRADEELLEKYHEGIIALSACLAGPVAKTFLSEGYDRAKEKALRYSEIFGENNFFLELQDHGIKEQSAVNDALIRMNKETGLPLVCTNDLHYINKEDSEAHDILLCIQTKKKITDTDRMRYLGSEFYLKSPEEMEKLFSYAPEAVENTAKIAQRCNVSFEFNKYKLPVYDVPNGKTSFEYLCEIVNENIKERYPDDYEKHMDRLNYELDTIKQMGFVDYFLIVWDFIKYAKDNSIAVGPGRGSAAGSLVAYCLHITDIDPIRFDLIFERFLNPERVSMPDIDIDFCIKRRQEVINYVSEKYGHDHVAQIVTFGTMAAKNSIRDVGRVLDMPYAEVDSIAKMIPNDLHITIKKALEINPELNEKYHNDEKIHYLIDMSMKLEGLPRHCSTHAAGVVICDRPIVEYVPLNLNDDVVTTQYTMTTIEELGLLKMDFLGLRNLTIIQNTFNIINSNGRNVSQNDIDYDDPEVFKLISSGNTEGVFQLESSGMKQFMKNLKPQSLEDIIAGISLYRPGPMDFIPKYIDGKNNSNVEYTHPALEEILKPTYGCIVYQEQVMQIVQKLAGYSLGRSDLLRRAMSKKKADVMAKERDIFINGLDGIPGCIKNGIDEKTANKIFDEMTDFAKYAFNKSHAAAYAVVAYQTAWLKRYYSVEFTAALLSSVVDNQTKVAEYIDSAKNMGIRLLPPDINEGFSDFSVTENNIRFGLSAIKNVGKNVIDEIVKEREENGSFSSMSSFVQRLGGTVNSKCLESLILAGAFDSVGGKRRQYMQSYKKIISHNQDMRKNSIPGQLSLFDSIEDELGDDLPDIEEYPLSELLSHEKEMLGIYVSGNPLDPYKAVFDKKVSTDSRYFINSEDSSEKSLNDGEKVVVGGIINSLSCIYTKSGKPMCFMTIEDNYGTIETVIFSDLYTKCMNKLKEGEAVLAQGRVNVQDERDDKVICSDIKMYSELLDENRILWLKLAKGSNKNASDIAKITNKYLGHAKVMVFDEQTGEKFSSKRGVSVNDMLISELKELLGDDGVKVKDF